MRKALGEKIEERARNTVTAVRTRRDTMSAPPQPLLLRLREVAILLGVSERQVWSLIRGQRLPVVRPPGIRAIRVAREDVEALVASWRSQQNSDEPAQTL
jgi:excisionase family DNA binding protein